MSSFDRNRDSVLNELNSGDAGGDGTAVWNEGRGLLIEKLSAACSSGVSSCGIDFIAMLMLFDFVCCSCRGENAMLVVLLVCRECKGSFRTIDQWRSVDL